MMNKKDRDMFEQQQQQHCMDTMSLEEDLYRLSLDIDETTTTLATTAGLTCSNKPAKINNTLNGTTASNLFRTSSAACRAPKNSGYYTIGGRTQQNSRQFSKYYYKQVGTFLTQYKIRENYKFLQMISVPPLDPAVPKPEGGVSVPACGEPLIVPASFPQSIEAAIHKFANASSKATCISVIDQYGKAINSLTYGRKRSCIWSQ
jgi:hypothetical protein